MTDAAFQFLRPFAERPWNSLVEISLLAGGIYYTRRYFRGTRGARILVGLTVFLTVLTVVGEALNLFVLRWLLARYAVFLPLFLVVIFQPELRRIFADLGSRSHLSTRKQNARVLDALCGSVFEMASRHCGALIAIERGIGLRSYAETGVAVDAAFSAELLQTIFHPKTALHDGGVILRNERIAAAACIFPVTQREGLARSFGLRHRAGLGLAEETDAVTVVVSEETGSVSLCIDHSVERGLTRANLRRQLGAILLGEGGRAYQGTPVPSRPIDDDQDLDSL